MAVRVISTGVMALARTEVAAFTGELGRRVRRRAETTSPVASGKLRSSIAVGRVTFRGLTSSVKVSTNTGYGLYPEEGTGLYGPLGQVIRPKRAPFLVFQPRGLGHVIRVRSVKGQPGQHYMRDALIAAIRTL